MRNTREHRILFFHSHVWRDFYRNLLLQLLRQSHCAVAIVAPDSERYHYRKCITSGAEFHHFPDISRPCCWEKNTQELRRIDGLIAGCEKATGRSANRILLGGERDLGRGFSSDFFYWPKSQLQKFCLQAAEHPHMALRRLFHYLDEIIERFAPTTMLCRFINSPEPLTAWFLSRNRGIPCWMQRFSKIIDKRCFWTTDYHMYNIRCAEQCEKLIASGQPPSAEAIQYIEQRRVRPQTIDYIAQNWSIANRRSGLTSWLRLLGAARENLRHLRKRYQGPAPYSVFQQTVEQARISLMAARHARYFETFNEDELASMRYAYFPLHKEPELMLNFESPLWHDQRHAAKYLASMLPADCKLLVREHRFNWGRRYTAFLKFLRTIPNVHLVNPFDPQFKYIANANLIITDNGSSGLEGLIFGRKVMTLERTFYDCCGLQLQVRSPLELDRQILDLLAAPDRKDPERLRRLGLLYDAERATTLPIETMVGDVAATATFFLQLLEDNPQ